MSSGRNIFNSGSEDFLKIYFLPLFIFLLCFIPPFSSSLFLAAFAFFLLSGGHVYSTMLEVYFDPDIAKKKYVWLITGISFMLTMIVLKVDPSYFGYYIFYFGTFHGIWQGLGITLLSKDSKEKSHYYKLAYYFLTIIPFLILHCRQAPKSGNVFDGISTYFNIFNLISENLIVMAFYYLLMIYIVGMVIIYIVLLVNKKKRILYSLMYFSFMYSFAFIFSQNIIQTYVMLSFAHAIPYYFLMQKRIKQTHSISYFRKYSYVLVSLSFLIGAFFEFNSTMLVTRFHESSLFLRSLVTMPVISHFLFDGIIWKHNNARQKIFNSSLKKY